MTNEIYMLIHKPMWTKAKIRGKMVQVEDLRKMMLPGAVRYDKDRVQSSPEDPMIQYAIRLTELEEEIKKLQKRYLEEQQILIKSIEKLKDPNEQYVLIARYVKGIKVEDVAEEMHVSDSTAYRWHRVGLAHLNETIGDDKNRGIEETGEKKLTVNESKNCDIVVE